MSGLSWRENEQLEEARQRGFLTITAWQRRNVDQLWDLLCFEHKKPYIRVQRGKRYAHLMLDLQHTGIAIPASLVEEILSWYRRQDLRLSPVHVTADPSSPVWIHVDGLSFSLADALAEILARVASRLPELRWEESVDVPVANG